jgi:hypothetical protein
MSPSVATEIDRFRQSCGSWPESAVGVLAGDGVCAGDGGDGDRTANHGEGHRAAEHGEGQRQSQNELFHRRLRFSIGGIPQRPAFR